MNSHSEYAAYSLIPNDLICQNLFQHSLLFIIVIPLLSQTCKLSNSLGIPILLSGPSIFVDRPILGSAL